MRRCRGPILGQIDRDIGPRNYRGEEAHDGISVRARGHEDENTLRGTLLRVFHRSGRSGGIPPGLQVSMASGSGRALGLRATAESWLDRLPSRPAIGRLDPYLGVSELRRLNPLLAFIPIGVMAVLGARTSEFGHMDTVGGIFPIMSLISALNPLVGLLSGLAYGASDFIQKFIVDDIFYEGDRVGLDYWGARVGYLLGYSSMIMFGLVPGVMARIGGRVGDRAVTRSAVRGANVAAPSPRALLLGRAVGRAVGGALGGLGAALAYQLTAAPAFVVRATADFTCWALSRANVAGAIPVSMVAAAGGGAASTLVDGIGSDAQVGDRRKGKDREVCEELAAQYRRMHEGWESHCRKTHKTLGFLQLARLDMASTERNRIELIEQQQSAVAYMLGAGALAGAVVGGLFARFCARMASSWEAAGASGANMAKIDALHGANPEAWHKAFELLKANGHKAAYWAEAATRAVPTGLGTGVGAGYGAGKALQEAMDEGLADFTRAAEAQARTIEEIRDQCVVMVHDENQMRRELDDLRGRLVRECGIEPTPPSWLPLRPPPAFRPPASTR